MAAVSRVSCRVSRDLLRIMKAGPVNRVYVQPLALFSNVAEEKEIKESDRLPQKLCKGINYFKEGQDPPLLPDSEYPDWLWTITETKGDTQSSDPDNVQHWRKRNKAGRRQENEIRKQQRK